MKDIKKKKQEVAAKFIKIYCEVYLGPGLRAAREAKSEQELFKNERVIPI
jgi:hypothetical protein